MKPIQTVYHGYRFRSRTEARWALFFETMGFRWVYEEQGFVLDRNGCYLPDFRVTLPNEQERYCEVQGEGDDDFDDTEMDKLREFADSSGTRVLHLTGLPDYRAYHQFIPGFGDALTLAFFQDYEPYVRTVDDYWLSSLRHDKRTGRAFFTHDQRGRRKSFGQGLVDAVTTARHARFEHGEQPK